MNKPGTFIKRIKKRVQKDNERGSKEQLIEELFYDFERSRVSVYKINFIRGIFFGFGSVLGGTIVVALVAWLLSAFVDVFPPLADFINNLIHTMQARSR